MQRQFADSIETQQNVTAKNKDQIVRLLRLRLHAGIADISRRTSEGLLCLVIIRIRSQHTADCSEHRSELKSHILPEVFFSSQDFPWACLAFYFRFHDSAMRFDLPFAWALLQHGGIIKSPLHFRVARVRAYRYLYQARCTYRITIALEYIIRPDGSLPEFTQRCRIYIKHKLALPPSQFLPVCI